MKKLLLVLMACALIAVPAMAMDTISDSDLGGITGQAGVTIAFGGTTTTTISFTALSWGDPDGYGSATAGYLVINGGTVSVASQILDGEELTLDVATAGAGGLTVNSVVIPGNTSFIRVGLPDMSNNVNLPSTMNIGLGSASNTISGTLGTLSLTNLSVGVDNGSALYIYAH